MDISKIPAGRNPPYDVNVIVENSVGGSPVKYEFDKSAGVMVVDRIIHTAMTYPGNHGFILHTLSGDGDPVDVIVVGRHPVIPGAVLRARPIGVLLMEDEKGADEKILAVPVGKLKPDYDDVHSHEDLPGELWEQIAHFFAHYKDLEDEKWVRIAGWEGPGTAAEIILAGIERRRKAVRPRPVRPVKGPPMNDSSPETWGPAMSLHRVRLELAPCAEAPNGDSRCGYELTVPLDRDGRLLPASWLRRFEDCRVRRFWFGQEYRSGVLINTGQGRWAFSQLPGDSRGQPIWRLESDRLIESEIVRVTELDGVVRPFRVARVRALLRLFGRQAAEGNIDKRHS